MFGSSIIPFGTYREARSYRVKVVVVVRVLARRYSDSDLN